MVIGVTGPARSGKDSICDYLVNKYNFTKLGFSDSMYIAATAIFGFSDQQLANCKEEIDEFWGISPREALQKLGTEGGRDLFGKDIWIRSIQRKMNNLRRSNDVTRLVIRDMRYDNEAGMVRSSGGSVWHVQRSGFERIPLSGHRSEGGVEFKDPDRRVLNYGSLADLHKCVDELINTII